MFRVVLRVYVVYIHVITGVRGVTMRVMKVYKKGVIKGIYYDGFRTYRDR